MLFTFYISLVGFYHQTPLNELDNYFRFLLLLPLLIIAVDDKHIVRLLSLCAIFGLVHAYNADAFLSINDILAIVALQAVPLLMLACHQLCLLYVYTSYFIKN